MPLADWFDRLALGPNWTTPINGDVGTCTIIGAAFTGDAAGNATAGFNPESFVPDQFLSCDVPVLPTAGDFFQLGVRTNVLTATPNAQQLYFLRVTPSTSTWDIRLKNNAPSVSLGTATHVFNAGDGAMIVADGDVLIAGYKVAGGGFVPVFSVADTTITAGGFLCISMGDAVGRIANALGGALPRGPGTVGLPMMARLAR